MDIISIVIFLGIMQGIFLSILLLTLNRGNKKANRLFGILMLLFSFSISGFAFYRFNLYEKFPHLFEIPQTVIFLFGPFFYFYVRALTRKDYSIKNEKLYHFIPFFLLIIYKFPVFIKSGEEKLIILKSQEYQLESLILVCIQLLHLFIYLYFISKLIKEHTEKIKNNLSSIDKINLSWIKFGIYAFILIFVLIAAFAVLYFFGIDLIFLYNDLIPLLVSVVILLLGFLSLQQPIVFPEEEEIKVKKYERSTLTSVKSDSYLNKLQKKMNEEKLFLQSDLTLQKLADSLSISPHHLSQIINEKTNQNFFDFINSYRIEEAKRLLSNPRGQLLTILAIAEEVGFNSKSAFNNAFKKYTGMTPTEYKKNI